MEEEGRELNGVNRREEEGRGGGGCREDEFQIDS